MPTKPGERGSLADRFEKLDRTGRRCVGSDMRCERNAAFILTVVEIDPDTGLERGEPEQRRVCPRHRKFYADDAGDAHNGFKLIREADLPPLASQGGVERAARHQQRIDEHVQKLKDKGLPTY